METTILCSLDVDCHAQEIGTIDEVLELPPKLDLLNDSDVWIADGGCSIHCTGYQHGMMNVIMHGHSGGEGYAQPDGSESKTISTGDMPVTLHDKYGQEVVDCRLTGINFVKGQRFNLFRTTNCSSTAGFLAATPRHYGSHARTQTLLLCSISRSRQDVDVFLLHIFVGVKSILKFWL
jgi:hypothetical protein